MPGVSTGVARMGSRVAVGGGLEVVVFALGEQVVCPHCTGMMEAPCVAPAVRCAYCREVIYPSAASTPPVQGSGEAGNVAVQQVAPQAPATVHTPTPQELAQRYEQNRNNPLIQLLAQSDSVVTRVLEADDVGLVALCRLRRVSKGCFESVDIVLRRQPPVVLLGGEEARLSGLNVRTVKSLDLVSMGFSSCADMPNGRCFMATCGFPDGRVLMAGGSEGRWRSKGGVSELDKENVNTSTQAGAGTASATTSRSHAQESASVQICKNDSWTSLPPMTEPRAGARAVVLDDGRVLVAGGSRGELYLRSVEVLDVSKGTWTALPDMHFCYCHHAIGKLPDGRVIVAGGLAAGQPGTQWQLAEIYDPAKNRWSILPTLSARRQFCAGCVDTNGRFIVSGGEDERGVHATCEAFNPVLNCWEAVPDLIHGRAGHTMCRIGGALFVAGGRGNGKTKILSEIEVLDVTQDRWRLRATDPKFALVRSGVAAVALMAPQIK
jgi:hypothetical protein